MNKILCSIIAVLVSILLGIGAWWVNRVNNTIDVVEQLQFRSLYLNGQISAAPVATPAPVAPK